MTAHRIWLSKNPVSSAMLLSLALLSNNVHANDTESAAQLWMSVMTTESKQLLQQSIESNAAVANNVDEIP